MVYLSGSLGPCVDIAYVCLSPCRVFCLFVFLSACAFFVLFLIIVLCFPLLTLLSVSYWFRSMSLYILGFSNQASWHFAQPQDVGVEPLLAILDAEHGAATPWGPAWILSKAAYDSKPGRFEPCPNVRWQNGVYARIAWVVWKHVRAYQCLAAFLLPFLKNYSRSLLPSGVYVHHLLCPHRLLRLGSFADCVWAAVVEEVQILAARVRFQLCSCWSWSQFHPFYSCCIHRVAPLEAGLPLCSWHDVIPLICPIGKLGFPSSISPLIFTLTFLAAVASCTGSNQPNPIKPSLYSNFVWVKWCKSDDVCV